MKLFGIFRRLLFGEKPKVLGRWNIDYCEQKMNKKVDYSNEDHCGPCGRQNLLNIYDNIDPLFSKKKIKNDNDNP